MTIRTGRRRESTCGPRRFAPGSTGHAVRTRFAEPPLTRADQSYGHWHTSDGAKVASTANDRPRTASSSTPGAFPAGVPEADRPAPLRSNRGRWRGGPSRPALSTCVVSLFQHAGNGKMRVFLVVDRFLARGLLRPSFVACHGRSRWRSHGRPWGWNSSRSAATPSWRSTAVSLCGCHVCHSRQQRGGSWSGFRGGCRSVRASWSAEAVRHVPPRPPRLADWLRGANHCRSVSCASARASPPLRYTAPGRETGLIFSILGW